MQSCIIFGLLVAVAAAIECPNKWRGNVATNACYLFVSGTTNVTQPEAQQKCRALGAHLTGINSPEEEKFLITYASQGETYTFSEQPWIGLKRRGKNSWVWEDGTAAKNVHWAKGEPNNLRGIEDCVKLNTVTVRDVEGMRVLFKGEMGTINDTPCDRVSTRYICRQVLPKKCDVNSHVTPTGCVCNTGFTDIINTTIPDGQLYNNTGMKCIATDPCCTVAEPQTMVFIMDASGSVTAPGWDNLLKFVETAAPLVPKNTRVHFIKYSEVVSATVTLNETWTEQDFLAGIPRDYDDSMTATNAAIDAATVLLKNDTNVRKTVILMTDGTPSYPDEMPAALLKLKSTGTRLLAVGFGKNLEYAQTIFENWLENPSTDYFPYYQATSFFTSDHMKNILSSVCGKP